MSDSYLDWTVYIMWYSTYCGIVWNDINVEKGRPLFGITDNFVSFFEQISQWQVSLLEDLIDLIFSSRSLVSVPAPLFWKPFLSIDLVCVAASGHRRVEPTDQSGTLGWLRAWRHRQGYALRFSPGHVELNVTARWVQAGLILSVQQPE